MPEFEPITGRYITIDIAGERHRIFIEEAGHGCRCFACTRRATTARQFRHMMNDGAITGRYSRRRLRHPYHGRSTPPGSLVVEEFRLTTDSYFAIIRAVWLALGLERRRCSAARWAAQNRNSTRGPLSGRAFRHRWPGKLGLCAGPLQRFPASPAIHGGDCARAYTYGLNSPLQSGSERRENWWYYPNPGPGVYQGERVFLQRRLGWRARDY